MEERNWWVSWYCPDNMMGKFELHSPWWISGQTGEDDAGNFAFTICAAVKAKNEDQAKLKLIMAHDPGVIDWASTSINWRFVEPRDDDWAPFCDRFQRAEWMQW